MSWESFKESPWLNDHRDFHDSELAIRPAPEYANSEILLAALYRKIGLQGVREKDVPPNGKALLKSITGAKSPARAGLPIEDWSRVLQGSLESPRLPNQSAKRFLQMTPVVPEVARYSGSPRLAGNPWSPGELVERMVLLGSPSLGEAERLWTSLFNALSVMPDDDVWARWLQEELLAWLPAGATRFELQPIGGRWATEFWTTDARMLRFPARQFVKDLGALISVKDKMTRRQWTSLLESVIRVAAVAHVLWQCDVQQRSWGLLRQVLEGGQAPSQHQARDLMFPVDMSYFPYGKGALEQARLLISRFLHARLGINSVLWGLDEAGAGLGSALSSSLAYGRLAASVEGQRKKLVRLGVLDAWQELLESQARVLACASGAGSNMKEFVRHVIGKRQTASDSLRAYDQGYAACKKSEARNAKLLVSLGPVAVLAMTHCCLHEVGGGARPVHRLCEHLSRYGIDIGREEVAASDLAHKLRLLGLVLDSPDAESGMLVLPPFPLRAAVS